MTLAEALPPPELTEVARWTIRSVDDLAMVRAALQAALQDPVEAPAGGSGGTTAVVLGTVAQAEIQRIVLVASELATNALRHGSPPFSVRLLRDESSATVDVVDHRPDVPPVLAARRAPGAGGFGLQLARRVSREVGWFRSGDDEKHVWACFRTL
ncbi:ATP-binding protein [Xylanimonas oleitrophica]|uniref:ATP-binding protein n=1 Tax=Xylanimonas oleitrophica TaxID=2607479 RepID=A0A2W5WM60_9MICO|nr:ATP-binding protein [Xylanimonas oleitrophica]PZR52629.1 ATP-binding protein [Xylanimonas oleitrophica]